MAVSGGKDGVQAKPPLPPPSQWNFPISPSSLFLSMEETQVEDDMGPVYKQTVGLVHGRRATLSHANRCYMHGHFTYTLLILALTFQMRYANL